VIAIANDRQRDYDIDLIVTMSGRCSTLKIAGRDLACRAVKYFHAGRAGYFTIAIDDAADNSHIVSFSGETARQRGPQFFRADDRPDAAQSGDRGSMACASCWSSRRAAPAPDRYLDRANLKSPRRGGQERKKYELQFDSDGQPVKMQRISWGLPESAAPACASCANAAARP
jgi:hypothetical protein